MTLQTAGLAALLLLSSAPGRTHAAGVRAVVPRTAGTFAAGPEFHFELADLLQGFAWHPDRFHGELRELKRARGRETYAPRLAALDVVLGAAAFGPEWTRKMLPVSGVTKSAAEELLRASEDLARAASKDQALAQERSTIRAGFASSPDDIPLLLMKALREFQELAPERPLYGDLEALGRPVAVDLTSPTRFDEAPGYKAYLRRLDRVRAALSKTQRSGPVESVFYPASGSDAAFAVRLFPMADVIALDNHPFVPSGSKSPARGFKTKPPFADFAWTTDLNQDRYHLPRLIGSLQLAVPGLRIREVRAFSFAGEPKVRNGRGRSAPVHGLVLFDSGPGTRVRRYLHINGEIPERSEDMRGRWWYQELMNTPPGAVLVKASQKALSDFRSPLHFAVLGWLKATNGWLIEGTDIPPSGKRYRSGEMTGYSTDGRKPAFKPELIVKTGNLGYGDRVLAYRGPSFFLDP